MADFLISLTDKGLYCAQADVFIDPWKPVKKALITHAHADHARWGSQQYLAHQVNQNILRLRLGKEIQFQGIEYNKPLTINGVQVSFHPAGHVWGSSQIKLSYKGESWVVTGDYKLEQDGFSTPYEPVTCEHFVTESTFGLPMYRWQPQQLVFEKINQWWSENAAEGKTSILTAYALGKAQRLLVNVNPEIGKIYLHGAVANVNQALIADGAVLPITHLVDPKLDKSINYAGCLVIAPPSALGTAWMRRFYPYEVAHVSGWMTVRGIKRRRNAGKSFVLSDHADWPGLNEAVKNSQASYVYVTHGYKDVFAKWLSEKGYTAQPLDTLFEGESED